MTEALGDLIAVLQPVRLETDLFRGVGSSGDGAEGTYGGHFLGQATAAALATVAPKRVLYSLHAVFLRAGQPGEPIEYAVERVRDGRSFCTRRVIASQAGRALFDMTGSFTLTSDGEEIPATPPSDFAQLPAPASLPKYHELMGAQDPLPLPAEWALREHGIDVRVINAPWATRGPSSAGGIRMWIRANGALPKDPRLHSAMLAYQSDESLADCLLIPFGLTWSSKGVFLVSLDHALWLHRPIDLNAWHFVEQWPQHASGSRGLASARLWSHTGQLVASFTQEVLMRIDPDVIK